MKSVKSSLPLTICMVLGLLFSAVFSGDTIRVGDILDAVKFTTSDKLQVPYYSLIKRDNNSGSFYLGSSGYVYKVHLADFEQIWALNINKSVENEIISCEDATPDDQEVYWCENQISVIEEIDSGNGLLVCGTNAVQPRCWKCSMSDDTNLKPTNCTMCENGRTNRYFPSRPDFDSTWLYVNDIEDLVYVGTEREASKDSFFAKVKLTELFQQSPPSLLTNNPSNENWLNMPAFVGEPVRRGEYIYFFFRETATEYKNAGKIIYSRVGRICADNSAPSPSVFNGYYQTLVKARLNCSIDLDFPFYFNEIQDVYMSGDIIYGVFTTPREGPPASAVCAYSWLEIEDLFNEKARYKGQETSDSDWLPERYEDLSLQDRPGTCGVSFNTQDAIRAVNDYNLINQLVPSIRDVRSGSSDSGHSSESPLLYYNNYRFNSITKVDNDGFEEVILMIGTNDGKILKAYFKPSMRPDEYGAIVSEIELDNVEHEVRDMITYTNNDKTYVIATAVSNTFKIPVVYCNVYTTCEECKNAQDPNCFWNGASCEKKESSNDTHKKCYLKSQSKKIDILQAFGDAQHVSTRSGHFVNFYGLAIAKKGCNFVHELPENDNQLWSITIEEGTATDAEFFAIRLIGKNETLQNVTLNLSCSNERDSNTNMTVRLFLDDSGVATKACAEGIYNYDCELARYKYELTALRQKILQSCHRHQQNQEVYQCPSFTFQDLWQ